jgi:hypothetical protein
MSGEITEEDRERIGLLMTGQQAEELKQGLANDEGIEP